MKRNIKCISEAFQQTINAIDKNFSDLKNNKKRSSRFIRELHNSYENIFGESEFLVFSKGKYNKEFKRSEYLFDLMIGRRLRTNSFKGTVISFIASAYLCLESEFARNNRESIIDFNKLLLADSEMKIMILPSGKNNIKRYLEPIKPLAEKMKGTIIVCFLPHPREWDKKKSANRNILEFYTFIDNEWEILTQEKILATDNPNNMR